MKYEVEQKFPVADLDALRQRLVQLGGRFGETVQQVDRYYAHPCRDFAQTDEALRIRQVGQQNWITFKGPKLDAQTKTRRELELPLGGGSDQAESWEQLLLALGFTPVARVIKRRETCQLWWQDAAVEVVLDRVEGLGSFVELELAADDGGLDAARARILSLAERLGLSGAQRRSYLELLLTNPHLETASRT